VAAAVCVVATVIAIDVGGGDMVGEFHDTTLGDCAHSTRLCTSAASKAACPCDTCGNPPLITSTASRAKSLPRKAAKAVRIFVSTAGVVGCGVSGGGVELLSGVDNP
jgi:hypothetical protein